MFSSDALKVGPAVAPANGSRRGRWLLGFVALHLTGLLLPVAGYLGWLYPAQQKVVERELEIVGTIGSMRMWYESLEPLEKNDRNHFEKNEPMRRAAAWAYWEGMRDLSPRYSAWLQTITGPEEREAARIFTCMYGAGVCLGFAGLSMGLVLGAGMPGLRSAVACGVVGAVWGAAAGALADSFSFEVIFLPAGRTTADHSGLIGGGIGLMAAGVVLGWIVGHVANAKASEAPNKTLQQTGPA
jgi:hypothetical protein